MRKGSPNADALAARSLHLSRGTRPSSTPLYFTPHLPAFKGAIDLQAYSAPHSSQSSVLAVTNTFSPSLRFLYIHVGVTSLNLALHRPTAHPLQQPSLTDIAPDFPAEINLFFPSKMYFPGERRREREKGSTLLHLESTCREP